MGTITVNGVRLAYDEVGAGPPAIWVHGSWTDRQGARLVAPLLAERYRVITYDRRGHSQSERVRGRQGVMAHVADLAGVIEQLDAGPAHLVTNSFGSEIALKLALQRPELVASLCLHEPPLYGCLPHDPDLEQALDSMRARERQVVAELQQGHHEPAAKLFMEAIAIGPGAWNALPEQSRQTFVHNAPTWLDDVTDPTQGTLEVGELAALAVPVLLTVGERSEPIHHAVAACLAAAIPEQVRHTFEDAGHIPHLTHPDVFVDVVTSFLDDVAALAK
jgi:pimeloyl-ACP methyl ester carboxylesterase